MDVVSAREEPGGCGGLVIARDYISLVFCFFHYTGARRGGDGLYGDLGICVTI